MAERQGGFDLRLQSLATEDGEPFSETEDPAASLIPTSHRGAGSPPWSGRCRMARLPRQAAWWPPLVGLALVLAVFALTPGKSSWLPRSWQVRSLSEKESSSTQEAAERLAAAAAHLGLKPLKAATTPTEAAAEGEEAAGRQSAASHQELPKDEQSEEEEQELLEAREAERKGDRMEEREKEQAERKQEMEAKRRQEQEEHQRAQEREKKMEEERERAKEREEEEKKLEKERKEERKREEERRREEERKEKQEREEEEERENDGCDEHRWPDIAHGVTCGRCKVLVDRFSEHYETCHGYCSSIGRKCTGAWEEEDDSCEVAYQTTCESHIASSDAICRCTPKGDSAKPLLHGPTGTSEGSLCDESAWPDKDHDLVCGECKVLVDHFSERYRTCDGYCAQMGRKCVAAWEEKADSCEVLHEMDCDQSLASSDALCQCSPYAEPTTPTTTAATAVQISGPKPESDSHSEAPSGTSRRPGERVEVRDSAVSDWLPATVASVEPLRARPDGWKTSYRWDEVRSLDDGEEAAEAEGEEAEEPPPSCLCVFDVDRTLTSKQHKAAECNGTKEISDVWDTAYGGGHLVLSDLARGLSTTFCSACLRGVISAGMAGGWGSKERSILLDALGGVAWTLSDSWSSPAPGVESLLVVGAPDMKKQDSVSGILDWLREHKGVHLKRSSVHFFDDNDLNVPPFEDTGFNARQISCGSRDGIVGRCGGLASEVVPDRGVRPCPHDDEH